MPGVALRTPNNRLARRDASRGSSALDVEAVFTFDSLRVARGGSEVDPPFSNGSRHLLGRQTLAEMREEVLLSRLPETSR